MASAVFVDHAGPCGLAPHVCVFVCLHQLRQVSQVKRWDDVGTGRRTIRHSRLVESLDFPDEDFGVNLGIVSD